MTRSKTPNEPTKKLEEDEDEFAQALEEMKAGKQRIAVVITNHEYTYPNDPDVDPFVVCVSRM